MPELPEVETIVRGAKEKLVGKTIKDVEIRWAKTVSDKPEEFKKLVSKAKITGARRRGKIIILDLSNDYSLIIHLKLTGQLIYQDTQPLPHKYTQVIFEFTDGSHLFFNDLRKFGWLRAISTPGVEEVKEVKNLGIEPTDKNFTLEYFKNLLKKRAKAKIKLLLMDQTLISGIGNIYANEILWEAGVDPRRPAGSLSEKETQAIYQAIPKILAIALKLGGSSENTYVRLDGSKGNFMDYAKVYQKAGKSCVRKDGGIIQRITVSGRGTFFCPKHQK